MSDKMQDFLSEGMSRYGEAFRTLNVFTSEMQQVLKLILRENLGENKFGLTVPSTERIKNSNFSPGALDVWFSNAFGTEKSYFRFGINWNFPQDGLPYFYATVGEIPELQEKILKFKWPPNILLDKSAAYETTVYMYPKPENLADFRPAFDKLLQSLASAADAQ